MAGEYVFNLVRLTKQYNKVNVLDDVSLAFFFGAKIGVIGGNGSGKSTLLRILARQDTDFMGEAQIAKNVRIGYLPQEPQLNPGKDVQGNVAEGVAEAQAVINRYDEICDLLGKSPSAEESEKLNAEMDRLQDIIDANDLWSLDHNVELAMEALRLPPPDAEVSTLSGGEKRRVALCRLLISNPDVLLLDEPTNHLDAESVGWLETYLKKFAGTLVVVTHDRYFLNNVTEWTLELEGGHTYPYKGNYESWLEQKQALLDIKSKQQGARRKLLESELSWVRMNPSGRQAKSKARLKRYEELAAQQVDVREDNLEIQIPPGPRLGDIVVRAENLGKAFGDRLIMENVTFDLPRGGIVGVIGANGAGKTTLFKMITGAEKPTSGKLNVGSTVVVSYVDQLRDALNPDRTVYEEITDGVETMKLGARDISGRAYCSRFNLKGGDQQKKVGQLSGGERNRVHLAKMLKEGGNVLLLDEPTNDLDVETLQSLEAALEDYAGCAVVISHDRWFLDRLATHILAFEGDSHVEWFEGNFQDYEEDKKRRLGADAAEPKRPTFKKFAR
ncbi:MAG: putative ABC transporter ATP-binding protein YjjK [Verrucomicrobia bacterium ADurb.Bin345]|nr:MAG: putative ABC transporter ATP-binding protein YjjK [Verrucomicrobia bacterium ADurb.Bin345]